MKLFFENAEQLLKGIEELSSELSFTVGNCKETADICVTITTTEEDQLEVTLQGAQATICYGNQPVRFFRALGLLCEAIADGKTDFYKKEKPNFTQNGPMYDVARNMVFRLDIMKALLRKQALMGLNFCMLNLEDVFEVPEYPYFGHMRGRYSKAEFREMDAYAQLFGIELTPSIQCLGHQQVTIKWEAFADVRDTIETLMVENEATYDLIDKMLAAIRDCFTSNKILIGFDETDSMGGGRFRENHEYKPQFELFCNHLDRVQEIAKKYGFHTIVSSDMFFFMASNQRYTSKAVFDKEMLKLVPKDTHLLYWKYCIFDPVEYEKVLKLHDQLSDNIMYCGGIQTWASPVPLYDLTIKANSFALDACIRNNVKEIIASIWGDGGESCLILSLLGLMLYAEMDYNGVFDLDEIKKRFRYLCGVEADDIMALEKMNHPTGMVGTGDVAVAEDYENPSKYLVYNDPLIGLLDKHIEGIDVHGFYEKLYDELKDRGPATGLFAPAFDYIKAILYVLVLKSDYGIRLKKAYDQRDMKALDALYEEAKEIENRYEKLRSATREFYLFYHKPFGYEVMDMRLGTMRTRFETVRYHIDRLRADSSYRIEELEEERLYLIAPEDAKRITLMEYDFQRFFSANYTYRVFNDTLLG